MGCFSDRGFLIVAAATRYTTTASEFYTYTVDEPGLAGTSNATIIFPGETEFGQLCFTVLRWENLPNPKPTDFSGIIHELAHL